MAPKVKVLESNDLGHGVFYEVRPAAKGNPTVQVIVDGERLPAFRRRPDSSAQEQVRPSCSMLWMRWQNRELRHRSKCHRSRRRSWYQAV